MKCRQCEAKAVINMRQHKLALCANHYIQWIVTQTQRFIEKYHMFTHQDRILVAVSGGKDSLSLWDILWQLGYLTEGLYIGLGIDGGVNYSSRSHQLCVQFAAQRNLNLISVNVPQTYGMSIPEIAAHTQRGKNKPCSVCGLTKRHIMNQVALEGNFDVLVTGHNLDDEVATLFGNTLNWNVGYLQRQRPLLLDNHPGLVRKAKPLCRFYEREMAAYALVRGIEYIYDECPYAEGSTSIYYKGLLNQLELDRPGAKLSFYLSFLQAKETGFFSKPINLEYGEENVGAGGETLYTCPKCGQPTTAKGLCSFCRMMEKISR